VRVLVVAGPLLGHAFPLVPLARALHDHGHEVIFATTGESVNVRGSGLRVHEIPGWTSLTRVGLRMMIFHPRLTRDELRGAAGTRGVGLLFGRINGRLTDGAVAAVENLAPRLVVYEPLAAAGAVAAAAAGVPAVLHENSLFDGPALEAATVQHMRDALDRHGLAKLPDPAAIVRIAPPSVIPPQPGWSMRPVPYGGDVPVPHWLATPPADGRPRIVVSRSTVAAPGRDRLMPAVLDIAGGLDAEVVLIRPEPRTARGPLPPSVRVTGWVPLPAVLPACAGVVHHGGAGTTLTAMAAGVPQFVVPGAGDRRYNAGLVEARGVGLTGDTRSINASALRRLVTDPGIRENAAALREEIAAMPTPDSLIPRLVALTG
jgi:UDP:flavonoid glycosyltransferase YjiC (YdhE family)